MRLSTILATVVAILTIPSHRMIVHAELLLLQGPLQNHAYTAVPTYLHLGPQENVTISGRLLYLPDVNPCKPGNLQVKGQMIMVAIGACSPEAQYDAWAELGVSALISIGPYQPGGMFCYLRDEPVRHDNGLLYVQIYQDGPLLQYLESVAEFGGADVRLEPDPNPWRTMYDSSSYQILSRYLPALIQAGSALLAGTFLIRNLRQVRNRYQSSSGRHDMAHVVKFIGNNIGSSQIALLIRMVISGLLAFVRAWGGYFSTSNLSGPMQRFFMQELWGVTAVTALIVSSIWNKARQKVSGTRALSVRLLMGDFPIVTFGMYTFLVVLELTVATSYATYYFNILLNYISIIMLIDSLVLLVVAIQFVTSAIQLQRLIRNNPSSSVNDFVKRMSRLVTWLGVIMFLLVCLFMVVGGYPDMWKPSQFFLIMTLISILHSTGCVFITLLLKPQDGDVKKGPSTWSKPQLLKSTPQFDTTSSAQM